MDILASVREAAALPSTFGKAQAIVRAGKVMRCVATRGLVGSTVSLDGQVRGTGGMRYHVWVTMDEDQGEVIDYGCSCPAAGTYAGMCKHTVALVLQNLVTSTGNYDLVGGRLNAAPRAGGRTAPSTMSSRGTRAASARDVRRLPDQPTSSQISDLVHAIDARRVEASSAALSTRLLRRDTAREPVELLVELLPTSYTRGSAPAWSLKLRVRCGTVTYVVRNIGDLVRAWETGAEVAYGKRLAFAHVPAAFTPRAQGLLALVTRVVKSQQALFASRYQYWSAGRGTDTKELPLSTADTVELLDVMVGSTVTFDAGAGPTSGSRELEVCDGDPAVSASIRPAARGGYDLRLPSGLVCLATDTRLYLVDDRAAWRCSDEYSAAAAPLLSQLLPAALPLHIAEADLPSFCRSALPALKATLDLEVPEGLEDLVPPKPVFTFQVGLDDGEVSCRSTVAYGDAVSLDLYEPQAPGQPPRDLVEEYAVQDVVEEYFPQLTGHPGDVPHFDEADDELLYRLLTEGLRALSELGEVLLSERLRGIEAKPSPQVRVRARVKSGLLDLQVDSSGMSSADLAAYLASYKRKQRFVRLTSGDIVRLDDGIRSLGELADGLGVEVEELATGVGGLPSNRALFLDRMLRHADRVRLERDAGFRSIVRDIESFSSADIEIPASLRNTLRSYQVEGFRWLGTLERLGFGGILADDMGLGKTLQVIAHLLARKEAGAEGTTLVVCPASLVYNWMAELARFAPALDAVAVLGTKAVRRAIVAASAGHDVLVTSYDLMKRDVELYAGHRYARAILDEAQYIKNPGTQVAKAAKCLPADVRLALTGTPVENRVSELWSIFDFLMPGLLGNREGFAKRFEGPVEARDAGASRELRCLVAPFILRRLKADVLADLPDKVESVVFARMQGEQAKLYKASQDRLARQIVHEKLPDFKREKLQVLAELTKLRQICCDPRLSFDDYRGGSAKLDTLLELVRNALDAGHRMLVFSQFTTMLGLISERLAAEGVDHLMLTGSTTKEQRARLVARFQASEVPVFLISLKAGGVGLNLTAADMVIHYDPWWNVAAEDQATDRAHRIGQTRDVSVFRLIAQDTIEERILEMQRSKRELSDVLLSDRDGAISTAELTQEDVLRLLGSQSAY